LTLPRTRREKYFASITNVGGIGGDQKINLAATDVDVGKDGCPAADIRQVLDGHGQHLSLRCLLYGRADIESIAAAPIISISP
jgi:hypothetical protein